METYESFSSDVLIAGGAITGLWAAIRAKQLLPESNVLLVDKGRVSKTGCANWGAGNTACVYPTDDLDKLKQAFIDGGEGLSDPDWVEFALTEPYEHIQEMIDWGIPFERDEKGELLRKRGRGTGVLCVVARGTVMLEHMRRKAQSLGVKIVDKVMVTELLANGNGEVGGAVGFRIGKDELKPCVFQAPVTLLFAGPCGYKASFIGHRNITGDGMAMAYRHGGEFMGMEFAVAHNTGPRDFDIAGSGRFQGYSAKFINRLGERYMQKYDPVRGDMASFDKLLYGMANEVREGRGPLCNDMRAMTSEDYELNKKILWFTTLAMERMGLDFKKDVLEWIPCMSGNRATGAGLRIKADMSTTVPRLYVGGDTGGKYHYGAVGASTGMNFAWCVVSGYRAGESAAKVVKEGDAVKISKNEITRALEYIAAPLKAKEGLRPDEVIWAIQDAIIPYDVLILKHADRLNKALQAVQKIDNGIGYIRAADIHDLMKAHEANNMTAIAEMTLRASLVREETRGMHHRDDFLERNDANWKKWLYLKNEKGKTQFWVEDGPGKKKMLS